MFVELHIIQSFAPSNLNRDDTGAPKECVFGEHRRARISSQCLKRAIRRDGGFAHFLEQNRGGVRTRNLILEVAKQVSSKEPPPPDVVKVVSEVFEEGGIERDGKSDRTKIILFLERPAIAEIASQFGARWQELVKGDKETRMKAREELGEILVKAVKAPDIALFGRMIEIGGNTPFGRLQLGVDAACQVAHALSTHRLDMEFDYFTAVEELPQPQEQGASFLDSVGFNSACFYRYANIDLEQLKDNLKGDEDLARNTVEAFLKASVAAIPTGKQNSMAAHNPPSFIFAVVRRHRLWSLANAFLKPVRAAGESDPDLAQASVRALDAYWARLLKIYGDDGIVGKWAASLDGDGLDNLKAARVDSFTELVQRVMSALSFEPEASGGGR